MGSRINQHEFINSMSQKSAHKSLMSAVHSEGFNVEEEETLADGTVRVVVGWWVEPEQFMNSFLSSPDCSKEFSLY